MDDEERILSDEIIAALWVIAGNFTIAEGFTTREDACSKADEYFTLLRTKALDREMEY